MKNRYRLYRRKLGGVFYIHDSETGKQERIIIFGDSAQQAFKTLNILTKCNIQDRYVAGRKRIVSNRPGCPRRGFPAYTKTTRRNRRFLQRVSRQNASHWDCGSAPIRFAERRGPIHALFMNSEVRNQRNHRARGEPRRLAMPTTLVSPLKSCGSHQSLKSCMKL